jgi:hypothetical protein
MARLVSISKHALAISNTDQCAFRAQYRISFAISGLDWFAGLLTRAQ